MEQRHFYKNHEEVISILTKQYGFRYDGLGDNYEECFRRDSETPETIFIHPMSCSYYMSASRAVMAKRLHEFNEESDYRSEKSQSKVFHKLLAHLDDVAMQESVEIDLLQYRTKNCTSFIGRSDGAAARAGLKLNELDKDWKRYGFVIPADTTSFNPSFFFGFLKDSVKTLGGDAYDKKYHFIFKTTDKDALKYLQENIEDGLQNVINQLTEVTTVFS